ncbi:hypothetical protein SEA_PUPPER_3 [Gordonia phage Pupper]|uniref:Uncharacterized protein n=1 Tax=Gordonia phage Pupper TaxID=2571249 RepID=A0A4Y6EIC0_9CAUD|nr:sulfatase-modifying factor enzyme [Gordonia phage Pupper]QDF18490.1 hypothetical protein SEA_PUPPER_3 [Gordonia phage Pupper]QDF18723.1 hypothetical protein SEA_SCENTAE_3 [Gordonia phage SCentae]
MTGLEHRYDVSRRDGREVGWTFVLDESDPYTVQALFAYAKACAHEFPELSKDLRTKAIQLDLQASKRAIEQNWPESSADIPVIGAGAEKTRMPQEVRDRLEIRRYVDDRVFEYADHLADQLFYYHDPVSKLDSAVVQNHSLQTPAIEKALAELWSRIRQEAPADLVEPDAEWPDTSDRGCSCVKVRDAPTHAYEVSIPHPDLCRRCGFSLTKGNHSCNLRTGDVGPNKARHTGLTGDGNICRDCWASWAPDGTYEGIL